MDDAEHYAAWEWQPIERMPDGCNDVELRTVDDAVVEMCSCDYWWSKEKEIYTEFRYT